MQKTTFSIRLTYEALQKVNRPESETGWQYFSSLPNLAWKTGTSFGFRDGWAVGTTPGFVVGAWFNTPYEDITMIRVCSKKGFRAGPDCPETVEIPTCVNGLRSEACSYHQIIHLNKSKTLQVTSDCASPSDITNVPWFVLPPVMEFIYPTSGIKIFIPRDQTGLLTRAIPEVAHRNPSKKIFWHLDETYIGTTRFIHQIEMLAQTGNHILTVVDEDGNSIRCALTIIGKSD